MVKKEENVDNVWTIDELVALTDKVQTAEIDFRGKNFSFQFCELVEKEEPKFTMKQNFDSESEKMEWYAEVGGRRVLKMIEKANEKNPEGATLSADNWALLPSTLRYQISNEVMGVESDIKESFLSE